MCQSVQGNMALHVLLQVTLLSAVTAEFQWFLSRKYNDCKDVPEKTFIGTPIARKDTKHFVCWRETEKGSEWTGETFKLGDCGDKCCDLVSPVGYHMIHTLFIFMKNQYFSAQHKSDSYHFEFSVFSLFNNNSITTTRSELKHDFFNSGMSYQITQHNSIALPKGRRCTNQCMIFKL